MLEATNYNTIEEVLSYFLAFLPEPGVNQISSVSKYARVNNKDLKIKAIKESPCTGSYWSFVITLD